jgi:hypothetical protein
MLQTNMIWKRYMNIQSFGTTRVLILGSHLEVVEKKCHLGVSFIESHKVYYKEGSDASSQRLQAM